MSTRHSVDLRTAHGDAYLAGHGTSGSTSLETTPASLLETSGGTLLAADTAVQRRDGPRRLNDHDIDDDDIIETQPKQQRMHTRTWN